MHFDIFTLFPGMFQGPLTESILKRAQERGLLSIALHNIRDATTDRHHVVDDYSYGGGAGMVMKPEPIFAAVEAVYEGGPIILLTPAGRLFTQEIAQELAQEPRVTLLCGHYEGVDERVREHLVTDELSIGDYVLTGGELAAMVIVDAVSRLVPGVLANASTQEESHSSGLLEYPQYTGDILASHCCATLLAWMHLPVLLAPGGSLHLLLPSLPVHRPLVHNRQWITHLSLNVPSHAHQLLHNDRIVALLLAPVPVPGQSLE